MLISHSYLFAHPTIQLGFSLQMLTYNEKYTPNPELDQLFKDMAAAEAETKEE